jgi:multidrug efflux pump subunit AcrA (membrane-fusion protein)
MAMGINHKGTKKRRYGVVIFVSLCLCGLSLHAQIREHTRPGSTSDPARARYRLGGNVKGATELSNDQASDVNLTLNEVAVRPIQTWVRAAGRIDNTRKVVTTFVSMAEASFVKTGQRVRAFPPESKSSMFQAWVTKVTAQPKGSVVEITLSGLGHEGSTNYVVEIVTERGEFLSIPNEAIIEEGMKRVVYVQKEAGQYVPVEIQTGIQGELYTAVASGLKSGDQVVSFGSFFVDSEYKLKSTDQSSMSNDSQHH